MTSAVDIDAALAQRLVAAQFPQWAHLDVRPMVPSGWDNRVFRLGEHMLVRLPSALEYVAQVGKEQLWLPKLAPLLPLRIPQPLAIGAPASGCPWPWSVYRWIEGDRAAAERVTDMREFAVSLARFLKALQRIDNAGGPLPGAHNFHRGGALATYDGLTREAISALKGRIDTDLAINLWQQALATRWPHAPVWIHGDVSAGNLLLRDGCLNAVIDFGNLGIGDPACDLTIAWTFFEVSSREAFRAEIALDDATWTRARAWTLWKAAILAAGLVEANAAQVAASWHVLEQALDDVPHA